MEIRLSRLARASVLAAMLVTAGCGAAGEQSAAPGEQRTIMRLCTADAEVTPCGRGVDVGVDYDYVLYTHCGIRWAVFDGRLWVAEPPLTDGSGNPPPGWGNPMASGVMRLQASGAAEFQSGPLVARFAPAPPAYERQVCD